MIYSVLFDNQIKIWWEYNFLDKYSCYRITKDNDEYFTKDTHFSFKNLTPETEYNFRVSLVNEEGIVLKEIGTSVFKTLKAKNVIDVTKSPYNAVGDGVTLNTTGLQNAINDCTENDLVYIPNGVYLTGALDLKSNVELRLEENAVIQGTSNEKDYLPMIASRFEGMNGPAYRSLLNTGVLDHTNYGYSCENIRIYGGKIVGGGEKLRKNQIDAQKTSILKENGLDNDINPPAFYSRILPGRRRGRLIQFSNTKNILIADCDLGNGPAWNIHPIYCDNFTICDCKVFSHAISNGDGIDPDSSTNVIVFGINFDTGDDFVAIKSGKNKEGNEIARPSDNIKIFDCTCSDGHGIAIGSEMSGGVSNVTAWNCNFLKASVGISIKTNRVRGGFIKNAKFYNFKVRRFTLSNYAINNDGEPALLPPTVENIHYEDILVCGINRSTPTEDFGNKYSAGDAIRICGGEGYVPKNISLKNITLLHRAVIPYQIFIAKDVENLSLENIVALGEDGEVSPF